VDALDREAARDECIEQVGERLMVDADSTGDLRSNRVRLEWSPSGGSIAGTDQRHCVVETYRRLTRYEG